MGCQSSALASAGGNGRKESEALIPVKQDIELADESSAVEGCQKPADESGAVEGFEDMGPEERLEWIVAEMRRRPNEEQFQEEACGNLSHIVDQAEPKCGWEEIVLAMRRYSENSVIQEHGSFFLQFVAAGYSHHQKIVDAGAHGVLIQIMRNFPEHEHLQVMASAALATIANSTDEIKRQLCDAGAPEAMCTTMRTFGSNSHIQYCNVLGVASLALGDCRAADRFVANGAHLLIQDVAGRHSHLAGFCCAALTALCQNCNHDTSLQFLEDRSVNAICQALAKDLAPRHQEKGLAALLHLLNFTLEQGDRQHFTQMTNDLNGVASVLLQTSTSSAIAFSKGHILLAHLHDEIIAEALQNCRELQGENAEKAEYLREAASSIRVPTRLSVALFMFLAKEAIPVVDTVFDVVNAYGFFVQRRFKWFAALLFALVFHSLSSCTVAILAGEPLLAFAEVLTFGTAGSIVHTARSVRRGVKSNESVSSEKLEAVEAMISLLITADALDSTTHQQPFERASLFQWASILMSMGSLSLLAADLDKDATYKQTRFSHALKDSTSIVGKAQFLAFHAGEICCILVLLPAIRVARPFGAPLLFGGLAIIGLFLHIRSLLFGFEGDWVEVEDTVRHELGRVYTFSSKTIKSDLGVEWPLCFTSDFEATATTNLQSFRIERLGGTDIMHWSKGTYGEPNVVYGWNSKRLVRRETFAFYLDGKESGTNEAELAWTSVLRRVMSSFLTVPLLLGTTYLGAAHPAMLRWVRKLRPAVCLAIWALLITAAFNEPVRDTFLRPHTFVLLCIALFGLMLYIILLPFYSAMSNGETTRGEERASTRELIRLNTEG